jgi:hypothetical protein
VPHIGLPQIAPVTRAKKVNKAPFLADAIVSISKTLIFQIKVIIEQKKTAEYAKRDSQALGT